MPLVTTAVRHQMTLPSISCSFWCEWNGWEICRKGYVTEVTLVPAA